MTAGRVFNIMKYAIKDGPGIRTTVFFQGCPLRCWWCHNPESQDAGFQVLFRPERCLGCGACRSACLSGALAEAGNQPKACTACGRCIEACGSGAREGTGRWMTVKQVLAEVEKDLLFYDQSGGGVTFSGGEPLAQPEFLLNLLRECKKRDIKTAVDTSGYGAWETLQAAAPLVDVFLYDLKILDEAGHRQYTGVSNRGILQNFLALTGIHKNVVVRFPLIPGYTDNPANIEALGEFLRGAKIRGIEILPYHKIGIEKYQRLQKPYLPGDLEPPGEEQLQQIHKTLEGFHLNIIQGGISRERKG
jgi:pyruvate formate lyase activating enzyme